MMTRLLVENLPRHIIEKDISDFFSEHGRVVSVQLKFSLLNPPIAFVEYATTKEGEEAFHKLNGSMYFGPRLRLELWHNTDSGSRLQDSTQHRVHINNLPPSATAQDVKDLVLITADVLDVDVDRRGNAWASFPTYHEVERVIAKLDGADYKGDRLRVKREELTVAKAAAASESASSNGRGTTAASNASSSSTPRGREESRSSRSTRSRSRSRSPTRYRRRSPSRSPSRHRRSRSRSRSPPRSYSRRYTSRSRSRSR